MNKILFVKDYTNSSIAVSAFDGEKLFNSIKECFNRGETVVVDFKEINLTITAFLNSSIGKLYSEFSSTMVKEKLKIQNMAPDEAELLKLVIERAKDRFGISVIDD